MSIPDAWATFAAGGALLECVRLALVESTGVPDAPEGAGAPERVAMVPGAQIAWDDCECGQLTVHVPRSYLSNTFPVPLQAPSERCAAKWTVVEYVVTILRCAPGNDDHGRPPAAAALNAAAQLDHLDRWAVRKGITCCLTPTDKRRVRPWIIGETLAVGAEGNCVGSQTTVAVAMPGCVDC